MSKILAAGVVSVVAISYATAPQAVTGAVESTAQLGLAIGRAAINILTVGAGGPAASTSTDTGHIETLPDGTRVWIPGAAVPTPTSQP